MRREGRGWLRRAWLWCVFLPIVGASPAGAVDPVEADAPVPAALGPAGSEAEPPAGPPSGTPPAGPDRDPSAARLAQVDQDLAEIQAVLTTAHFQTALGLVEATRWLLDGFEADPGAAARRVRLEVMAATAELALGKRARARRSMARALQADPGLSLDEAEVSPKVIALLRDARRRAGLPEPKP